MHYLKALLVIIISAVLLVAFFAAIGLCTMLAEKWNYNPVIFTLIVCFSIIAIVSFFGLASEFKNNGE